MLNNLVALGLSFLLVFAALAIATLLEKKRILSVESARKFVHISVSLWWLLVIFLFDNIWFAIIPPIIFTILNYLSYRFNIAKSIERSNSNSLGTVYFPISLLILTILSFTVFDPVIGAMGIFILGFGDGIAALVGSNTTSRRLVNNKSLYGTLSMFLVSFTVAVVLISLYKINNFYITIGFSLVIAFVAAIVELITANELDNITVPLITSLVTYLLFLI